MVVVLIVRGLSQTFSVIDVSSFSYNLFFVSVEFEDDLRETNALDVTDGKTKRRKERTKVIC